MFPRVIFQGGIIILQYFNIFTHLHACLLLLKAVVALIELVSVFLFLSSFKKFKKLYGQTTVADHHLIFLTGRNLTTKWWYFWRKTSTTRMNEPEQKKSGVASALS